jgi:hypothetical protein
LNYQPGNPFRKLVHIDIKLATEQVIHFFIVMIILLLVGSPGSEINMVTELGIQYRIGIKAGSIDYSFFNDIPGAEPADCITGNAVGIVDGGIAGPVNIVQVLPVELTVVDIIFHEIIKQLSLCRVRRTGPGGV